MLKCELFKFDNYIMVSKPSVLLRFFALLTLTVTTEINT